MLHAVSSVEGSFAVKSYHLPSPGDWCRSHMPGSTAALPTNPSRVTSCLRHTVGVGARTPRQTPIEYLNREMAVCTFSATKSAPLLVFAFPTRRPVPRLVPGHLRVLAIVASANCLQQGMRPNPFAFWARAAQLAWLPWLGAVGASDYRNCRQAHPNRNADSTDPMTTSFSVLRPGSLPAAPTTT